MQRGNTAQTDMLGKPFFDFMFCVFEDMQRFFFPMIRKNRENDLGVFGVRGDNVWRES